MSHYMNWYQANSKICLTWFAAHPNIVATSRLTPNMETEPHPPQQSPPVIASMHDERLQPHPQSFEFTEQPHHHQEDYGYNPHVLSASGEEFMSNLIGKDLRTLESAYTYMQSMLIPSSTNHFIKEEQPVVSDEQLQPQEHGRVHRQPTRNRKSLRCGTGGH